MGDNLGGDPHGEVVEEVDELCEWRRNTKGFVLVGFVVFVVFVVFVLIVVVGDVIEEFSFTEGGEEGKRVRGESFCNLFVFEHINGHFGPFSLSLFFLFTQRTLTNQSLTLLPFIFHTFFDPLFPYFRGEKGRARRITGRGWPTVRLSLHICTSLHVRSERRLFLERGFRRGRTRRRMRRRTGRIRRGRVLQ